ncbi:MAG: hypothetical protein RQ741_08260 [Wenzhouxiangellaceae bacterium]|nr:hypothetical protein [Wenzhouxiangellaceae bacterium]
MKTRSTPQRIYAFCLLCLSLPAMACQQSGGETLNLEVGAIEMQVIAHESLCVNDRDSVWNEWLVAALGSLYSVSTQLPLERLEVALLPGYVRSRRPPPVSSGKLKRSNPPMALFYVTPTAERASLLADWRAYHEFAHLLIPFPGIDDLWFVEGLASYYQHILPARAGHIHPNDAWDRILDNLERADGTGGSQLKLAELNRRVFNRSSTYVNDNKGQQRLYWTGAAMFLRIDTRLRAESNQRRSLDTALAALHRCCSDHFDRDDWSATKLVEKLGELSDPKVWHEEFQATVDTRAQPSWRKAMQRVGIERGILRLKISDDPDHREMRLQIAGPRQQPAS